MCWYYLIPGCLGSDDLDQSNNLCISRDLIFRNVELSSFGVVMGVDFFI